MYFPETSTHLRLSRRSRAHAQPGSSGCAALARCRPSPAFSGVRRLIRRAAGDLSCRRAPRRRRFVDDRGVRSCHEPLPFAQHHRLRPRARHCTNTHGVAGGRRARLTCDRQDDRCDTHQLHAEYTRLLSANGEWYDLGASWSKIVPLSRQRCRARVWRLLNVLYSWCTMEPLETCTQYVLDALGGSICCPRRHGSRRWSCGMPNITLPATCQPGSRGKARRWKSSQ